MDATSIQKTIMKRIPWVDIYKGLAIILMVMGHTVSPVSIYIYLFHMPAFFFISGLTTDFSKYDFWTYFKKKTLSLLVPYIALNLLFLLLHYFLQKLKFSGYIYEPSSDGVLTPVSIANTLTTFTTTDPLGGATWFLVTLFETSIFAFAITHLATFFSNKYFKQPSLLLSFIIFLSAYYYLYNHKPSPIINYNLDLIPFSTFYFILGMFFKKVNIPRRLSLALLPLAIYIMYYFANVHFAGINFPTRQFNLWYFVLPATISGIFILSMLSIVISKVPLISVFFIKLSGATIFILAFHFLIFKLYFLILYTLRLASFDNIQKLVQTTNNPYWFTLTLFTSVISIPIYSYLSKNLTVNKYLFGKYE